MIESGERFDSESIQTPEQEQVPGRVIVTGGTEGIGRAVTEGLVGKGSEIALCARNPEKLAEISTKEHIHAYRTDLADRHLAQAFTRQALSDLGGVDCLILNAAITGIEKPGETAEQKRERELEVFKINQAANLIVANEALSSLEERRGLLVFITSGMAEMEQPPQGVEAYAHSKQKMQQHFQELAVEHPELKVLIINPGMVDTNMHQEARESGLPELAKRTRDAEESGLLFDPTDVGRVITKIITHRADLNPETSTYSKPVESGVVINLTTEHIASVQNDQGNLIPQEA